MIDNAFRVVIENKGSSLIQYEQIKNIINNLKLVTAIIKPFKVEVRASLDEIGISE